jgi:hypothetical protein
MAQVPRVFWSLSAAALLAAHAGAADRWVRQSSAHFDVYTAAGEKRASAAAVLFEQLWDFFGKAMKVKPSSGKARIVLFRGERDYLPYRINQFATAFYAQIRGTDYIVMHSLSDDARPVAVHEFTHLMVEHSGLKLPAWPN